jgi:hypothetical protein
MITNPFRMLRDTGVGRVRYALRAWLVAVVPSLLLFLAQVAAGIASLRPPANVPAGLGWGYSVLVAPIVETALMLPLAWFLDRAMPRHEGLRIVALAVACALAHKLGGNWRQVVNALWPFLVYATTLVAWRKRSSGDALAVTSVVHALYNASFFAAGMLGALAGTDA